MNERKESILMNTKEGMHVGVQGIGTSKHELQFLVRHGVTHMDAIVPDTEVETLQRHRQEADDEGVSLDMIHVDLPTSITMMSASAMVWFLMVFGLEWIWLHSRTSKLRSRRRVGPRLLDKYAVRP